MGPGATYIKEFTEGKRSDYREFTRNLEPVMEELPLLPPVNSLMHAAAVDQEGSLWIIAQQVASSSCSCCH